MVLYIQSSPTILIKDTMLAPILFNFCVASMSINAPSRNCMKYLDDSTLYHSCTLQKKRHMHRRCWKWNQLNWNLVLDRWHCMKSGYEYREILRTSPFSVQMLENTDQKIRTTFQAVWYFQGSTTATIYLQVFLNNKHKE